MHGVDLLIQDQAPHLSYHWRMVSALAADCAYIFFTEIPSLSHPDLLTIIRIPLPAGLTWRTSSTECSGGPIPLARAEARSREEEEPGASLSKPVILVTQLGGIRFFVRLGPPPSRSSVMYCRLCDGDS